MCRVWSGIVVLTLCAAFSVRPWSLPSGCPRSDGPSRRRAVSRLPTGSPVGDAGSELEAAFRARPSDRIDRPEAAGIRSECSGQRGGPKKLTSRCSFLWIDLPVGDRTVLPVRRIFRFLGRPMNYMLFSWAEPGRGSRSPRDPGFMNPTLIVSKSSLIHG